MISNPKFQVECNATVPKLCCPIVYLYPFLVLSMFKRIMCILEILSVASSENTRHNTTTPNISRRRLKGFPSSLRLKCNNAGQKNSVTSDMNQYPIYQIHKIASREMTLSENSGSSISNIGEHQNTTRFTEHQLNYFKRF